MCGRFTNLGRAPRALFDSRCAADTSIQGTDAKALLLGSHIDSQLEYHRVGREVNSSRYEGTDTKKPLINSL